MTDTLDREDAPAFQYTVFDLDGEPVKSFNDEDAAYEFADHDETVVTYEKV